MVGGGGRVPWRQKLEPRRNAGKRPSPRGQGVERRLEKLRSSERKQQRRRRPDERHAPKPSRLQRWRSSRGPTANGHSLKQSSRRLVGLHSLLRRSSASAA